MEQETRLYNAATDETEGMRSKEHAHDYRYFPEPDLVPLRVSDAWLALIRLSVPELPPERRAEFLKMGLRHYDAQVLTATRAISDYFETVASECSAIRGHAANWVTGDLMGASKGLRDFRIAGIGRALGRTGSLIAKGEISGKWPRRSSPRCIESGPIAPRDIIDREGLRQISDTGALGKIVDEVIANSPKQVEQYKSGKTAVLGYLVGQVMKASNGQANPAAVNELLRSEDGVAWTEAPWLSSLVRFEGLLTQPNGLRRYFDKLVVADELYGLLQIQNARRDQANGFIGGRGAHVGQLFFLHDVYGEVRISRVFADDHSFVDLRSRRDEDLAALLQILDRVAGGSAGTVGHQRARGTRRNVALPFDVAVEQRIHDRRASRIRQHFAAQPDQPARRDVKLQPHAPRAVIDHLDHLAFAAAEFLDDHADEGFRAVDHQQFEGLVQFAVHVARQDFGLCPPLARSLRAASFRSGWQAASSPRPITLNASGRRLPPRGWRRW